MNIRNKNANWKLQNLSFFSMFSNSTGNKSPTAFFNAGRKYFSSSLPRFSMFIRYPK